MKKQFEIGRDENMKINIKNVFALLFPVFFVLCVGCSNQPEPEGVSYRGDSFCLEQFSEKLGNRNDTNRVSEKIYDEVEVTILTAEKEGPSIYVVGGVHGDEPAGYIGAELLKSAHIQAGQLYIISQANAYGVSSSCRKTKSGWDLNRHFPGMETGNDVEQLAWAIYHDIVKKKPDLVLDLHEAAPPIRSNDRVGNTLICDVDEQTEDLIWQLLLQFERDESPIGCFSLLGSPVKGSINYAMKKEADIPAITVETDKEELLCERVSKQIAIIEFVLEYYGMI